MTSPKTKIVYLVSYDLTRPGQDYPPLFKALEEVGIRALKSAWLVETSMTALQIRDELLPVIDATDLLLITVIPDPAGWASSAKLLPGALEWLEKRRP